MRRYSAIFLLLFLLFFSCKIFAEENINLEISNINMENINIIETNQHVDDENAGTFENKNEEELTDFDIDLSKKFILKDVPQQPFKGLSDTVINENLPTIEGKIEENAILSLDDCIKKALKNNPKIKSSTSNTEIYKTKIMQAWSNYFPTFSMTNGLTRNRYFTINFTVEDKLYTFYNTIDLNVSQLLFDFGKTKALANVAKYNWDSSLASLNSTIDETIYMTTSAYYNLIYALEKKKVYEDTLENYKIQLDEAKVYYNSGKKSKIDVITAQYNMESAKLSLMESENEIQIAKAELSNIMGLPEYENYLIYDELKFNQYEYNFDELLSEAYENNSELRIYKNQIKASEQIILSSKRAFTPNFEAFGSFQDGGGTSLSDDYGWTIGVQFKCSNFNLLLMKKQLDEAKATYKKDLADLETKKNNLYLEVKQAYIKLNNAENSIPVALLALEQASEQHRLAQGRYKAGTGDAIELKDAEISYKNARLDYLYKILQYNLAVAETEKIIGNKLLEKDNNEILPQVEEIIE